VAEVQTPGLQLIRLLLLLLLLRLLLLRLRLLRLLGRLLLPLPRSLVSGSAGSVGGSTRSCWCARGAWAPSTAAPSARRHTGERTGRRASGRSGSGRRRRAPDVLAGAWVVIQLHCRDSAPSCDVVCVCMCTDHRLLLMPGCRFLRMGGAAVGCIREDLLHAGLVRGVI
jgi:hypothetical protein